MKLSSEAKNKIERSQLLSRYSRQAILPEVGLSGQLQISGSKVAVIGAGGIGSTVLMYLAAAGVGSIIVIDDDKVDCSNLHRQVIHSTDRQGVNKAVSAALTMLSINPLVQVRPVSERLTTSNAAELLAGVDVVVDATDNFDSRYSINQVCVAMRIPLVSAAAVGWEGSLTVIIPYESACYRCLYPEISDVEKCRDCSNSGVIGPLPGLIGCLEAMEVLKLLVKLKKSIPNAIVGGGSSSSSSSNSSSTSSRSSSSSSDSNRLSCFTDSGVVSPPASASNSSRDLDCLVGRQLFIDGRSCNMYGFDLPSRDDSCPVCGTGGIDGVVGGNSTSATTSASSRPPDAPPIAIDKYEISNNEQVDVKDFCNAYFSKGHHLVIDVRNTTQYGMSSLHAYYHPNAEEISQFAQPSQENSLECSIRSSGDANSRRAADKSEEVGEVVGSSVKGGDTIEFHMPLVELKRRVSRLLSVKSDDAKNCTDNNSSSSSSSSSRSSNNDITKDNRDNGKCTQGDLEAFYMCLFGTHGPSLLARHHQQRHKKREQLEQQEKPLGGEVLTLFVVCRRGNDSQKATAEIRRLLACIFPPSIPSPIRVVNVTGGLSMWQQAIDKNFPFY